MVYGMAFGGNGQVPLTTGCISLLSELLIDIVYT